MSGESKDCEPEEAQYLLDLRSARSRLHRARGSSINDATAKIPVPGKIAAAPMRSKEMLAEALDVIVLRPRSTLQRQAPPKMSWAEVPIAPVIMPPPCSSPRRAVPPGGGPLEPRRKDWSRGNISSPPPTLGNGGAPKKAPRTAPCISWNERRATSVTVIVLSPLPLTLLSHSFICPQNRTQCPTHTPDPADRLLAQSCT